MCGNKSVWFGSLLKGVGSRMELGLSSPLDRAHFYAQLIVFLKSEFKSAFLLSSELIILCNITCMDVAY